MIKENLYKKFIKSFFLKLKKNQQLTIYIYIYRNYRPEQ